MLQLRCGLVGQRCAGGGLFNRMTPEDHARENRDLRRMNQLLKEKLAKALEAIAEIRKDQNHGR